MSMLNYTGIVENAALCTVDQASKQTFGGSEFVNFILLTSSINQFSQFRITKIRHEISVIKTNSFDWELLTFDDIKKIAHFGISSQVLS